MVGSFEIAILSASTIEVILRGIDDIYEQGEQLVKDLKSIFPNFYIRCSGWQTRGDVSSRFYKIKVDRALEEARETAEAIKKEVASLLRRIK